MKKRVIVLLLTAIFLYSAVQYIWIFTKGRGEEERFQQLQQQVKLPGPGNDVQPEKDGEAAAEPQVLPQYLQLYRQNPDLVGWLELEGTKLNYPVMHTPDDVEYYLRRAFDQTESRAGTPFIGYDCSLEPRSDNILIYGHNMKNGTMFSPLLGYKDALFWQQHPTIRFDTLYEEGKYAVLAVFSVLANKDNGHFAFYNFTTAESEAEFDAFITNCKELSLYDTGITAEYGDNIITLATCNNVNRNGRFVVVAKKI